MWILVRMGLAQDKAPAGTCSKRLLGNFRLDGALDKKVASTVCQGIAADGNCCSQIDEIKIIKSWNGYTLPKMNRFADEMIGNYQKLMALDVFVKNMDPKDIRYHSEKYRWKKVSERKCFSAKYFADLTEVNKMIEASASSSSQGGATPSFYDTWAANVRSKVLNSIVEKINSKNLWNAQLTLEKIITPFNADAGIYRSLYGSSNNVLVTKIAADVNNTVVNLMMTVPPASINQADKKPQESITSFLNSTMDVTGIVSNVINTEAPSLNLKRVQDMSYAIHMKYIADFFASNVNLLVEAGSPFEGDKSKIVESIVDGLKTNTKVKFSLERLITSEMLYDSKNNDLMTELENEIENTATKAIDPITQAKGMTAFKSAQKIITGLAERFEIRDVLNQTFESNTVPFLFERTLHYASNELISTNAPLQNAIINAYNSSLYAPIKTMFSVKPGSQLNLASFKSAMAAASKTRLDIVLKSAAVTLDTSKLNFGGYYETALQDLTGLTGMPGNSLVSTTATNDICAVITKHNLLKETRFNKEKHAFCRKAQSEYKKFNVKTLYADLAKMRGELRRMLNLKKGFYCALCSQKAAGFIRTETNQIVLSTGFCYSILNNFKDYLKWKNERMVKYFDKLHQYLKCYETDGSPSFFPFPSYNNDAMALVERIDACTKIKSADEAASCADLCTRFSIMSYSDFFDGDKAAINKLYTFVLSTVRMYGFKFVAMPDPKTADAKTTQGRVLQATRTNTTNTTKTTSTGNTTSTATKTGTNTTSTQGTTSQNKTQTNRTTTGNTTTNATGNTTKTATGNTTTNATRNATGNTTGNATGNATKTASGNATSNATSNATKNATKNATGNATSSASGNATKSTTGNATSSSSSSGNATAAKSSATSSGSSSGGSSGGSGSGGSGSGGSAERSISPSSVPNAPPIPSSSPPVPSSPLPKPTGEAAQAEEAKAQAANEAAAKKEEVKAIAAVLSAEASKPAPPPAPKKPPKPVSLNSHHTSLAFLQLLDANMDKVKMYLRPKPLDWDETEKTYVTFNATAANLNFTLYAVSVSKDGMDIFDLAKNANFDIKVAQGFIDAAAPATPVIQDTEKLDRSVLAESVRIEPSDLKGFNTDSKLTFDGAFKMPGEDKKDRVLKKVKNQRKTRKLKKHKQEDNSILGFLKNLLFG